MTIDIRDPKKLEDLRKDKPGAKFVELDNERVKEVSFKIIDFIRDEKIDMLEAIMAMSIVVEEFKKHTGAITAAIPDKEKML